MIKVFSVMMVMLGWAMPLHDFHASITQIDVNAETGRLEVAVKLFTDDLETAVQPAGQPALHIGTPKEHLRTEALLADHLRRHLLLQVDGRPAILRFLGKETEADATWCYLESDAIGSFKSLTVTNTLLLTQFEDQVNIIHLERSGIKQAKMTNAGGPRAVFD